jgi:hypothetical protein
MTLNIYCLLIKLTEGYKSPFFLSMSKALPHQCLLTIKRDHQGYNLNSDINVGIDYLFYF